MHSKLFYLILVHSHATSFDKKKKKNNKKFYTQMSFDILHFYNITNMFNVIMLLTAN